jgi:hypothetical protein
MSSRPPRRAERLASWSLAPWERTAVLGDLAEEFHHIDATEGRRAASRWYWRQTIASIWPNVLRRLKGDERRRRRLSMGTQNVLLASIMISLSSSQEPHGRLGTFVAATWQLLLFQGGVDAGLAFFSERVQIPRSQLRIRRSIATVGLALLLFMFFTHTMSSSDFVLASVCLTLILDGLRLWPRWPPDPLPDEIALGVKRESPVPGGRSSVTSVPSTPLGLSGLVLCHPPMASGSPALWIDESTIHRTFSQTQSFRVCAAVNVGDRHASAVVDVVDASGRIARHLDAEVVVGGLAAIPRTWDDLVDADPPDHFGRIDATVDLHGLDPGRYTVRLTVSDGGQTSVKAEPIVVALPEHPAASQRNR